MKIRTSIKIPSYPFRTGIIKNKKKTNKKIKERLHYTLFMEIQINPTTIEMSMEVPLKIKSELSDYIVISLLRIYWKGLNKMEKSEYPYLPCHYLELS